MDLSLIHICAILTEYNIDYDYPQAAIDEAERLSGEITPVSYTHLDVYKRQLHSMPVPRRS